MENQWHMNGNAKALRVAMDTADNGPIIAAVIARLEEKAAVMHALQLAWSAEGFGDFQRRCMVNDVRRTIVDSIADLEACVPPG